MKNILRIIFTLLLFTSAIFAKKIPPIPSPPKLVNDYAGILSAQEVSLLESKLVIYNDTTSTQITIVTENSLEDDDIFDYSMRLAQGWGIGQKGKNNGVLIYLAIADRKMRIQVGYGLEAVLTDAATKRIIEQIMKPNFKNGSYYEGLSQASDQIIAVCTGQYKGVPKAENKGGYGLIIILIIFGVIFILSLFNKNKNNNGHSGGGFGGLLTGMLLGSALGGNRGGSSYGNFSSGSGSFGGFGGGSFGGGGSGGSW